MRTKLSKSNARKMRHMPTEAEQCLWNALRHRQIAAYKFRRQHPIDKYIVDFACISHRLIVEADGGQHADNAYDSLRTANLEKNGWKVLRFWNNEILENIDGVLQTILLALEGRQKPERFIPDILELVEDRFV